MLAATVTHIFGWLFALLAVSMFLPAAFALAFKEQSVVQAFLATGMITGFLGGGLIFALKGRLSYGSRREGLVLLCTVWFVIPCIAALPFYLSGHPKNFSAAYFEAVSGFTTTGGTIFLDLAEVPKGILVWRSFLQWLGGLTTLVAVAVILGPLTGPDFQSRQLRRITRSTRGTLKLITEASRTIFPLYLSLTFLCFMLLYFAKIPSFDAFCLSLSTLSTGGFMPRSGTISLYGSPLAELILAIFMFFGAVSIFWLRAIIQFQWKDVREIREPNWIGVFILLVGLLLAAPLFLDSPESGLSSVYHSLTTGLATAASFVTTSGFAISDRTQEMFPYVAVIIICLIGGGWFSTAGGLKFFRIGAMFRQAGRELKLLVFPHSVRPSRYGRESTDKIVMRSIWVNFAVVVTMLWSLALLMAATGLSLSAAFLASVSALSNIGPAYVLTSLPDLANKPSYGEMLPIAHFSLSFGMILGRLEVLTLLSLINLAYWRS